MIEQSTLDFLIDLKLNNSREWFNANKKQYAKFKANYLDLIDAFLNEMKLRDDTLTHLQVKDCAFRINRDIRFTNDKSPYKTYMGIWMSSGRKNTNLAGYYVQLEPDSSFLTGGSYWPDAADLKKIRREIAYFNDDLHNIINQQVFKDTFGDLDRNEENQLKTAPKDYAKDHPAIAYLKLKYFTATKQIPNILLTSNELVSTVCNHLQSLKPLNEFLNRALQEE